MELRFEFEKATKNTNRFQECSEEPVVGTLYVKKSAMAELGNPEVLVVKIEKGE